MTQETCRVDVWLWRARFCKTRGVASRLAESGRIRLIRAGRSTRVEKPSTPIKVGDEFVYAQGGRLVTIKVAGLGTRRGPAAEARALYAVLDGDIPVSPDALIRQIDADGAEP